MQMDVYLGKRTLVAGGAGMIGTPLVEFLTASGAIVTVASLESEEQARRRLPPATTYWQRDLTGLDACLEVTQGQDYVFNLLGVKGSTGIGETRVASMLVPMLWFQTNLMEAAFRNHVARYMFVSSVCAYPASSLPKREETLWDGPPRQNDRIAGLAKRIGEVQGEAYLLQHGWDAVRIVRPSNVYGPHDDTNPATAQVIPALIGRVLSGESPLRVWGDGSAVRDFIYSEDVAYWMLVAMQQAPPCTPVNLGSGEGVTVRALVEAVLDAVPDPPPVEWVPDGPTGDPVRVLSMDRARELLGFEPRTRLSDGLAKTVRWFQAELGRAQG